MATPQHILHIIQKRQDQLALTEQEQRLLQQWLESAEAAGYLPGNAAWEQGIADYNVFVSDNNRNDQALQKFMQAAGFNDQSIPEYEKAAGFTVPVTHRVHFMKRWGRWAAASILIVATLTVIFLYTNKTSHTETASQKTVPSENLPSKEKAILTLADGSVITLDSAANGSIAQQGNANIIKLADGAVQYEVKNGKQNETLWNTIATPKGGQYQVRLPDGSQVWLNAASSIRFPAVFGAERKVIVTGEVYMEIAKNKSKPFFVDANEINIQVLGTSFNVNVYTDEPASKITLVEGAIAVDNNRLKPGQALTNGKIITADIEQDLAWKNGAFNLNNKTLPELMRQIARWYDLDIQFAGVIPSRTFEGEIGMNLSLAQCIRALERMQVHCRLEGKKLIVLP